MENVTLSAMQSFMETAPETSRLMSELSDVFKNERAEYIRMNTSPEWQEADDAIAALVAQKQAMPAFLHATMDSAIAQAEQKRDAAAGTTASEFDANAIAAFELFMRGALSVTVGTGKRAPSAENAGAPSGRPSASAKAARRRATTLQEVIADPTIELIGADTDCDCALGEALAVGFIRKDKLVEAMAQSSCEMCKEYGNEIMPFYGKRAAARQLAK